MARPTATTAGNGDVVLYSAYGEVAGVMSSIDARLVAIDLLLAAEVSDIQSTEHQEVPD